MSNKRKLVEKVELKLVNYYGRVSIHRYVDGNCYAELSCDASGGVTPFSISRELFDLMKKELIEFKQVSEENNFIFRMAFETLKDDVLNAFNGGNGRLTNYLKSRKVNCFLEKVKHTEIGREIEEYLKPYIERTNS